MTHQKKQSDFADEQNLNKSSYLSDYSEKDKKWDFHKCAVDQVSHFYSTSTNEKHKKFGTRVYDCAELLRFMYVDDLTTGESKLKLNNANFCRVRLCPVCQWRRSMAWRAKFFQNLPKLFEQHQNLNFIFLTLTVKNIDINNLSEQLKVMNSAWNKLRLRKEFSRAIKGYVRATEVTKNKNDAHPHFHCILAVNKKYLTKRENYISQEKWCNMWKECLKIDYIPVVDVRKIKIKNGDIETKAIIETLKYTTKIEDLLSDKDWFLALTDQLANKRFLATGGVFKEILKEEVTEKEMLVLSNDDEVENEEDKLKSALYFGFDHFVKKYKKVKNPYL